MQRCLSVWWRSTTVLFALLAGGWSVGQVHAATAVEVLAAHDKELTRQVAAWHRAVFDLSDRSGLDEPLRSAAQRLADDHVARVQAALPGWIEQARLNSGNPLLQGIELANAVYQRAINELSIWSIDSGGVTLDAAWLTAALSPTACQILPPTYFSRRIAMIQAAPAELRSTLLEGERELLSRWGSRRENLPRRPTDSELEQPDVAIRNLRTGLPVRAEPMTPFLAGMLFDVTRKAGVPDRWEQCAKSQWWLATQLAYGMAEPAIALNRHRYATMLDYREFLPDQLPTAVDKPGSSDGVPSFPPEASYFGVQGVSVVQIDLDGQGRLLKARIEGRKVRVPGVYDNPPLAFEALFDAASIDYAAKRKYSAANGRSVRLEVVWRLEGHENEIR